MLLKEVDPELILAAYRITLHTESKLRRGGEHGTIYWSANHGNKQCKQETVRNHHFGD
jgi:hypothetical protein